MDRLSVFYPAKNDAGYVQAVISCGDLSVFEGLGFVTSIDDLKPEKEPEVKAKSSNSKANKKADENGSDANKD